MSDQILFAKKKLVQSVQTHKKNIKTLRQYRLKYIVLVSPEFFKFEIYHRNLYRSIRKECWVILQFRELEMLYNFEQVEYGV